MFIFVAELARCAYCMDTAHLQVGAVRGVDGEMATVHMYDEDEPVSFAADALTIVVPTKKDRVKVATDKSK